MEKHIGPGLCVSHRDNSHARCCVPPQTPLVCPSIPFFFVINQHSLAQPFPTDKYQMSTHGAQAELVRCYVGPDQGLHVKQRKPQSLWWSTESQNNIVQLRISLAHSLGFVLLVSFFCCQQHNASHYVCVAFFMVLFQCLRERRKKKSF